MQEHFGSILFATLFFPSAAAYHIFAMKYGSAVAQARVRLGQDEAYREIAAKAAASQAEIAALLSSFGTVLAEIQSRIGKVERILKDVE